MGILFGGVTDEDTSEETLESVFHNDLYGYHTVGNGRWVSMALKKPKKKGTVQKMKAVPVFFQPAMDEYDGEEVSSPNLGRLMNLAELRLLCRTMKTRLLLLLGRQTQL
jgi:hypothetical protein